jgi:hypothetical protein
MGVCVFHRRDHEQSRKENLCNKHHNCCCCVAALVLDCLAYLAVVVCGDSLLDSFFSEARKKVKDEQQWQKSVFPYKIYGRQK